MTKYKTHLVIGDAHSNPEISNARFEWLGNFIIENKPDVIIDIGDWGEFNSLSSYGKGTKEAWGQSFKRDVECFKDASKKAFGRIKGCKNYKPLIIRLGGNHEEGRINRFVNDNPELEGLISLDALGLNNYGAYYVPFREVTCQDGIFYCHYFYDRDSRYPITNARTLLQRKYCSATWGHTHIRDFHEGVRADGRRLIALNAGCFLDPSQFMGYAGPQARYRWWSGLVLKHDVHEGQYDPEFLSIERIQREYS